MTTQYWSRMADLQIPSALASSPSGPGCSHLGRSMFICWGSGWIHVTASCELKMFQEALFSHPLSESDVQRTHCAVQCSAGCLLIYLLGMDLMGDEDSGTDSASFLVSQGCLALFKRKKKYVSATVKYSLCYTKDRGKRRNTECRQRGGELSVTQGSDLSCIHFTG